MRADGKSTVNVKVAGGERNVGKAVRRVHAAGVWPEVEFSVKVDGEHVTRRLVMTPTVFHHEDSKGTPVVVRVQVPLILSYALTVHKAQGATLERVALDLTGKCQYGHVYSAMSRVRRFADLRIIKAPLYQDWAAVIRASPVVLRWIWDTRWVLWQAA